MKERERERGREREREGERGRDREKNNKREKGTESEKKAKTFFSLCEEGGPADDTTRFSPTSSNDLSQFPVGSLIECD